MKAILNFTFTLLIAHLSFAQVAQLNVVESSNPIIEGCQKINTKNNKEVKSCWDKKTQEILQNEIKNFSEELESIESPTIKFSVRYSFNKEGKITRYNVFNHSNKEMHEVFKKIVGQAINSYKILEPAKGKDGEIVQKSFTSEYILTK